MERFFWSLKHDWPKRESFTDLHEARLSVSRYIETFYNTRRIHQSLDYRTPAHFEAQHEMKLVVKNYYRRCPPFLG
jgi:putative transposase